MTPEKVMAQVMVWAPLALLILSAINAATGHYSRHRGIIRAIMAGIERLSFVTSVGAITKLGRLKMPGMDVIPGERVGAGAKTEATKNRSPRGKANRRQPGQNPSPR